MRLTVRQIKLINEVQEEYKHATQLWGENPAEFDSNIRYLADLEKIARSMMGIFKYEFRAVRHGELKLDKVLALFAHAQQYLVNGDVSAVIRHEFAKEPRIMNVSSDIFHNQIQIAMYKAKEMKFNYVITFSNGTELNFQSLQDEKVLDKMRRKFESEMEELALHQGKRQKV